MRLRFAVVDPNTLAAIGLRHLLQRVMPMVEVETFGSFAELEANHPEEFVHYFVAVGIFLEHRAWFQNSRHQTIVLTTSPRVEKQLQGVNTLCVNQPERTLARALLSLEHHGHPHGHPGSLPASPGKERGVSLTSREAQVLALIVKGYINKQIAEQLGIALTTVITHRKNIMEKLQARSVSALTIHAVMHGYVDIDSI
ncbi:MAG: response regulator transcription factor [Prevotella sp.]|nr:response regulator transcription factor [Prevotella sp.]